MDFAPLIINFCKVTLPKLEKELKEMDEVLINPETYKQAIASNEFYSKYESIKKELEKKLVLWEKLISELEDLKKGEN